MANISVSDAAGAGFKLIGSKPVSVFIWGLFLVLVTFVPFLLLFGPAIPQFVDVMRDQMAHPATPPQPSTILPFYTQMNAASSLMRLGGLLSAAVINAAVYRAVIQPRNRGFAYLQFGMREIWLIVLNIAEILLWIGLFILAAIAVAIVAGLAGHFAGRSWGVLAGFIGGGVAAFTLIVVALRLSMAAPMTFADGEFRLFQSWRLTRGHAWQIFLVALLLFAILLAVGLVVVTVEWFTVMPLFMSFATNPHAADNFSAMVSQPPTIWLKTAWPWVLAAGVGLAIYTGVLRTILAAPWATIYRMLKGEAATA
jgi:hypothetical protein